MNIVEINAVKQEILERLDDSQELGLPVIMDFIMCEVI